MKFNIPTLVTWVRISAIPVFVLVFYLPFEWAHYMALLIFVLAALTDWLDGYLARNLSQMTRFGAFLDPVADKLLVAVVLVLIVGQQQIPYLALPAVVIVGREIVVSALREWMAEMGKRTSVAVSFIGKAKTTAQMVAIPLLLLYQTSSPLWLGMAGVLLLHVAAGLTLWSMLIYLRAAWPDFSSAC